MRLVGVILMVLVVGAGCARLQQPTGIHRYGDHIASSLAFDPPVIADEPALELSRAGRGTTAFVGFEEVITTHFYLRTDDHQRFYDRDGGHFDRRAVSETFGTRYR
jgi:hypothetical protein